jgi:hypothetical protein
MLRWFGVVATSAALHVALALACRPEPPPPPLDPAVASLRAHVPSFEAVARRTEARARRVELVARAREARAQGELRLGAFLLEANAIDAREDDVSFDEHAARLEYQERLEATRRGLERQPAWDVVPSVLGDVTYVGRPGGRMGDALLARAGSCEPVSQLVAALLHDAGIGDRAALRFYGGVVRGASHLAPVLDSPSGELDLSAGARADLRGARFSASELVEAYARAHGLAPRATSPARPPDPGKGLTSTRTLTSGFPSNDARFEGAVPLFAQRAVRPPSVDAAAGARAEARAKALACGNLLPLAELDPPRVDAGGLALELRRVPTAWSLEHLASVVALLEEAVEEGAPLERASLWGCLAGLRARAAAELALAGRFESAEQANRAETEARQKGAAWLAQLPASARHAPLSDGSAMEWAVLFLEGGSELLAARVSASGGVTPHSFTWSMVVSVAALVVQPASRARGLELAAALRADEQIEVMHELYFAHQHARPWSSNYALELPEGVQGAGRAFAERYGAFRAMAFRLWEAPVAGGQVEPLDARSLLDELDRAARGFDPAHRLALLEYAVRNLVTLYSSRPSGLEMVTAVDSWLASHGEGRSTDLRRRLATLQAKGTVDSRTLADAFRP